MSAGWSWQELPDKDLVVAFQTGDAAAYDEMYRRYAPRVTSTCWRMLRNSDDAKEATQETFLKAYTALPRFNGNYQLGAWFTRIAVNACLDQIRVRARGGQALTLAAEPETVGADLGPEELVAGGDARVDQTIEELSPLHAQALLMRGLEGLSHEEIATRLHMTAPQVKALLHRARTSFKRAWKQASGWAIAPVLNLRAMLSDNARSASGTSSQLAAFGSTAAPVFAERMAASAMIVAVAITGIAAGDALKSNNYESVANPSDAVTASAPRHDAALSPRAHHESILAGYLARVRDKRSLIDDLEKIVREAEPPAPPEDDGGQDYDGDGDKDLGLGQSRSLMREAERTQQRANKAAKRVEKKIDKILP